LLRAKILYLSYDGLTDPLGQSQVLPYLLGLAKDYDITLITFEKSNFYDSHRIHVVNQIASNLVWLPQRYTKTPAILSTIFDLVKLRVIAKKLVVNQKFDIVHCRSYLTSIIGLWLKRKYNIGFLFDMRGFWADERVEGRLWNINNPLYNYVYNYFKTLEREYFIEANHIISLTKKAIEPVMRISNYSFSREKISVIPCCVDVDLFKKDSLPYFNKEEYKAKLGFGKHEKILIYVGSLGTWYLLDEMLDFYNQLQRKYSEYKLLIVTRDKHEEIIHKLIDKDIDGNHVIIKNANRQEVVCYIAISDISYYFIQPTFSKLASSPTKLAEYMSMGIPVITNTNIGDIELIAAHLNNGIILINNFNKEEYEKAINKIPSIMTSQRQELMNYAQGYFSLKMGIDNYNQVYKRML